jgi:hypothetical protein
MNLYIDGDAFPNLLKPILLRAIERTCLQTFVISNKQINLGRSEFVTYIMVDSGFDEADQRIVEMVQEGDLVITTDIPLADQVITKKAHAMDHRGGLFTADNIKSYLMMRNLNQDIRDRGEITRGPAPFGQKDAHGFANRLDQFLTRQN